MLLFLEHGGCGAFEEIDDHITMLAKDSKKFADKYQDKIKIIFTIIGPNYQLFKMPVIYLFSLRLI